ncbi:MAG: nucleotidyl transferase AbiEii/AbiGii toxin family protein [Enterobacterales bacterium]|nr:nucleotidyl transferase AbiEii/AbiGii toxin family protein [Enterobacterales bacterium]
MANGQRVEYSIMNLHEDNEAFAELVEVTAERIGLPQVYVEKDYWVTKALKHLSESPHFDEVVFKGGTSLSKAYRLIDRFSEDIDLAIFAEEKNNGARKRLLKSIESVTAQGLTYLKEDARESKGSNFRKTVYQYPHSIEGENFGQASSELLIEINSFANPEPFESRKLQTLIAEVLAQINQSELIAQYSLEDFSINVLSVSRTLVEKMLGVIKDSYSEDPVAKLSGRIRHLYDICLILKHDEYRDFVTSDNFNSLCNICIEDEKVGFFAYSDCFDKPLNDAPLFSKFKEWRPSLKATYVGLFADLVYGDLPKMDEIEEALSFIKENIR